MLKYGNIIGRLNVPQKIALLTDLSCLSSKEFKNLGIPELNISDIEKYMRGVYPAPSALANSFDVGLVSEVAKDVSLAAAEEGTDLLLIPSAKAKIEPYRLMLSEDPMLASSLAGAYLGAASVSGVSACVSDYCINDSEAEWMDRAPDPRVVYDFIVKPTAACVGRFGAAAVAASGFFDDPAYRDENIGLLGNVACGGTYGVSYAIVKQASGSDTVDFIKRGIICIRGDALAVENAIKQYETIKKYIDKGDATLSELEEAEREGKAFSPEMLDAAADRVIDFLMNVCRRYAQANPNGAFSDQLFLRSVKESAVLLKNDGKLLPLKKKTKLCLIGDAAMLEMAYGTTDADRLEALLSNRGYSITGQARGYDFSCDRSDELIDEALFLAEGADKVLLFLGTDDAREKDALKRKSLELPANQVALAARLASRGADVIAVVSSAMSFDIGVLEKFGAVLLLTLGTKFSADALAEILSGEYSPSGRLANTLYRNTDDVAKKQRQYRLGGAKSGPFIGYRYYDTAEIDVGFPFGHGLGYTAFSYSKERIKGSRVSVTVKNTGKLTGVETVQFYIGKSDSSVVRPRKELMAFEKIRLVPGESRTVTVDIRLPEVYDAEQRQAISELGEYTIYIGRSVSDTPLTLKYSGGSGALTPDKAQLYEYLQSESNVIAEKYTLEANYTFMKRSLKNILSGLALLILAAGLQVYCHIAGVDGNFLNIFSLTLVVLSAVFFVAEMSDRAKAKKQAEDEAEAANKEYFKDAETIHVFSTDRMFDTEFDETVTADTVSKTGVPEDLSGEYLKYVDKNFDFAVAAKEFERFASERGYKFEADTVRGVFASLASSRIMIVDGLNDADFKSFMYLLCEYFESALYLDAVDASYTREESLLLFSDAEGRRYKRTALLALESASVKKHAIHLSALTNVRLGELPNYIIPFVKYAKNPTGSNYISTILADGSKQSYYIPPNMWFVLNLAPNQTFDAVPAFISEIATVTNISFRRTDVAGIVSSTHKFYYYQMDYLAARVTAKYELSEENWKKFDALSAFVAKRAPYTIGNKQWLCLEAYVSTFVAAGGETDDAMDHALAVKILPSVLTALNGCDGVDLTDAVNNIFGDERMNVSRDAIKLFAKNKTANAEQGAV